MNHEKATEGLKTSVSELTNLMNDTFTCCMRNYEALLPYLEKNETKLKIYHKLVQVNILLNKLNEELVGLRVEYVTVSSYEQKRVTVLSVGGQKRKASDIPEIRRYETKIIKTELPFPSNTNCSIGSSSTGINIHSANLESVDTEETKHTQVQKSDMHRVKNVKTEIQDSYKGEILAAQTSCDTTKNKVTDHFVDDEESASVTDRNVRGSVSDKPADTVKRSENNDECVSSQIAKSQTCNQESCEDSGNVLSKDHGIYKGLGGEVGCATSFSYHTSRPVNRKESCSSFTTCNNESATLIEGRENSCYKGGRRAPHSPVRYEKDNVPAQSSGEQFSAGDELYGVISYKKGKYKCTLCNLALPNYKVVHTHLNGMKHIRKQMGTEEKSRAKNPDVPDNSSDSTASLPMCAAVPCSLVDTVAIIENNCQLESMKDAVKLDDLWKYFPVQFQINKKYFRVHSNQVICSLCNQHVGENVLSIRIHIIRPNHMKRIKKLTGFEVAWKSANRQLMNVPGILDKIIPKIHFTVENYGFFCKLCRCFCENDVVLNHLTGKSHGRKLHKKRKS